MVVFKILLIILIAAPVIALGTYFYMQMLSFIKEKNRLEKEAIQKSLNEPGIRKKRTRKKSKKSKKNAENTESEQNR